MTSESAASRVYNIVRSIPAGKVLTYGDVAKYAGIKNPRQVGYFLHHNPDPSTIPCHRVVNAQGKCAVNFAFGLKHVQETLLQNEGVNFISGHVDMAKNHWTL